MGHLRQIFRYKVFVDALFHAEVMSIFNLPIDKWEFMLVHGISFAYIYDFDNGIS